MQLFNRNSPDVIQAAAELTEKDFIHKYKSLTTEIALKRIYIYLRSEIKNRQRDSKSRERAVTKAPISKSGVPLSVDRLTIQDIINESKKIDLNKQDNIDQIEKLTSTFIQEEIKDSRKEGGKPFRAIQQKVIKEEKLTKRQIIYNLIVENPVISMGEIKKVMAEMGYDKVYYSEIMPMKQRYLSETNKS